MTTILEDDTKELDLPFAHSEKDRVDLQVQEQIYLKDVSLVSHLGDIDQLNIDFDNSKDFK